MEVLDPKLTKISGVGPATAQVLADHGFATAESVAAATSKQLAKVPGFAEERADRVIAAAGLLVSGDTASAGGKKDKPEKKGKKGKKGKGKKGKGKGKGKGKKKDGKKKRKK